MYYVLFSVLAYLLLGLLLSRKVLAVPRRRLRFWDAAIGAVVMPVLSLVLLVCVLTEDLWKRLLIVLDFTPPEEMRAGPKPPAAGDSKDT